MAEKRNVSARWWRQVGFWGLTINMILGGPVLVITLLLDKDPQVLVTPLGSILTAWCVAAGIRQWGKNAGGEE